MNKLQPNPVTGFLESINPNTGECFTSDRKVALLALADEFAKRHEVPDLSELCDKVGIKYATFREHCEIDPKFSAAWQEVKHRLYNGFTQELSVKARSKNGIVANIAILRWLESGTFNPELRIQNSPHNQQLKGLSSRISGYIEGEIVPDSQPDSQSGENER